MCACLPSAIYLWRVSLSWNILLLKLNQMKNYRIELMNTIRRKTAALRILEILKGNSKNCLDAKTAARIANEAKHRSRKRR